MESWQSSSSRIQQAKELSHVPAQASDLPAIYMTKLLPCFNFKFFKANQQTKSAD
jgi:hypothetical protein